MPETIIKNVSLAPYTTLGIGGPAEYLSHVHSIDELTKVVAWAKSERIPITCLGGGSNILVGDHGIRGLVIRMCIDEISYKEAGESTYVTVGAGVMLDTLVATLVDRELWGLENLSSIPGTVGGVPIQNVGAYGVEAKDIVHLVDIFDYETGVTRTLTNEACAFAYRDSIFKQSAGRTYIVTHVTFKTEKIPNPKLAYADLAALHNNNTTVTIHNIRTAIIEIRKNKFPDWNVIGTAGSFFKNPIITNEQYDRVKKMYPELKGFPYGEHSMKVSLGWILDHVCGLKGYTDGDVGLYAKQALVLVCTKGISADVVLTFSQKIIDIVYEKTEIIIEREVTTCID